MNLKYNKIVTLVSITLLFIILIVLVTIVYLKSRYHKGLDKEICNCKGLNYSSEARIVNGTAVNNDDLEWIASIFNKKYINGNDTSNVNVCTALFLNSKFLLSAAYCFKGDLDLEMKNLYVAAGRNDNIEKAYVTKENYRKVKNVILHPDFDPVSYSRDLVNFVMANANKELILDLKCYIKKDYIDKLIIEKNLTEQLLKDLENDPLEYAKELLEKLKYLPTDDKLMPFRNNVYKKLQEISRGSLEIFNFTMDNNIALVELEQPFEFGKGILPSCLFENNRKQFNNSFIYVGFDGSTVSNLRKLKIIYAKNSEFCLKYTNRDHLICAISEYGSPYFGDSGGPLFYPIKDKMFVTGVAHGTTNQFESFNELSIHTYVYPYLSWIDSNIGHNRCLSDGNFYEFNLKNLSFYIICLICTCSVALTLFYFLFLVKK